MQKTSLLQILNLSDLDVHDCSRIMSFTHMCDRLVEMTDDETACLFSDMRNLDQDQSFKKVNLLQDFERDSHIIMALIRDKAPKNMALMHAILNKISVLQEKLRINTELHFYAIKRNPLFTGEDYTTCH